MGRGRPTHNDKPLVKFRLESEDYDKEKIKYYFDRKIHGNSTIKTEIIGSKLKPTTKINVKQKYIDAPVVVVFTTSNRKNAKIKIKVFKSKNIDDVILNPQPGIPKKGEILEIGVGEKLVEKYKKQYNL